METKMSIVTQVPRQHRSVIPYILSAFFGLIVGIILMAVFSANPSESSKVVSVVTPRDCIVALDLTSEGFDRIANTEVGNIQSEQATEAWIRANQEELSRAAETCRAYAP